ncbi:hypothetical protein Rhopal_003613-T1 [Rhodotorula paludigena]|uniref:Trafficking protein particle complex subunit 2-like protein n=1 Tax=Rhodotorula paludigena TaxID=86838 RepID=A0AAV5GDI5_9BASI|nr:hypothetical protein Rhopal_003613-T1 [Rhodotorula paludigena]
MSLAVLSIAVLGRQGNPLFLESYSQRQGGTADLKWHYAAHTALDFFDERGESSSSYGYQTNTRINFVLALALADAVIRDVDVKTIFRAIHNAYIAHLSNPFTAAESDNPAVLAAPIRSRKFAAAMAAIAGRAPATGGE